MKKRYNLILDIDETLVHCKLINNKLRIILRPNLKSFLEFCYAHFNVSYWTVGVTDYCENILKIQAHDTDQTKCNKMISYQARPLCKTTSKP